MSLIANGLEVYVTTMTKFIPDSYDYLEENLTHMKSLKLKIYPGGNVSDCCNSILVDNERLEISGAFNTEHLEYITRIFEYNYDSRFCVWEIHKYKDFTEFIEKICVFYMDVIPPEDLITYESLGK